MEQEIDNDLFKPSHLRSLHREFSKIERVDPDSPAFTRLRLLVASWGRLRLQQVGESGVKWLSYLAKKRLEELEREEWRSFKCTPKGQAFLAARDAVIENFGK